MLETPPRAWGRRLPVQRQPREGGNTPTSVGKTYVTGTDALRLKKHPHERGEDEGAEEDKPKEQETPPRAWGRRRFVGHFVGHFGNTPTSVGKTLAGNSRQFYSWKHPHERGEDTGFYWC